MRWKGRYLCGGCELVLTTLSTSAVRNEWEVFIVGIHTGHFKNLTVDALCSAAIQSWHKHVYDIISRKFPEDENFIGWKLVGLVIAGVN